MNEYVIDTNVPIVANGHNDGGKQPCYDCQESAINFLINVNKLYVTLVDLGGEIVEEYRRYLNPSGQPGVGDRFYFNLIQCSPERVRYVDIPKGEDNEYLDLPDVIRQSKFDPSDRKFAALARKCNASVVNATDSDWLECKAMIEGAGILILFLCGEQKENWYSD